MKLNYKEVSMRKIIKNLDKPLLLISFMLFTIGLVMIFSASNVTAFMKYYAPDVPDDVLTLFSEVVQETYARFGINHESDFTKFKSEDYPTLADVYETIRGRLMSMTDRTHEKEIMERLELKVRPLVRELKYYF